MPISCRCRSILAPMPGIFFRSLFMFQRLPPHSYILGKLLIRILGIPGIHPGTAWSFTAPSAIFHPFSIYNTVIDSACFPLRHMKNPSAAGIAACTHGSITIACPAPLFKPPNRHTAHTLRNLNQMEVSWFAYPFPCSDFNSYTHNTSHKPQLQSLSRNKLAFSLILIYTILKYTAKKETLPCKLPTCPSAISSQSKLSRFKILKMP